MMKKVRINSYQIGLVFKNGEYEQFITAGTYWFWFNREIIIYDITKPFYAPVELSILMQDEELMKHLTIVDVRDNEIAIEYKDGKYSQVLRTGRYAYWNSIVDYKFVTYNTNELEVPNTIEKAILKKAGVLNSMKTFYIDTFEKGLLIVNGEFKSILETGIYRFWNNTNEVSVIKADIRSKQMEISGQELLTKDKAAIRMNVFVQYKVSNVKTALLQNKDYERQLYVAIQLVLRDFVGTKSLDELLESKETIANYIVNEVKATAETLGVQVANGGVRDIILPGNMKEIMNQVLIAEKQAQANTISRRDETAANRSLLNTAKLLQDNEMMFTLKEMEYAEKIADKIGEITLAGNSKVIDQLKQIFTGK